MIFGAITIYTEFFRDQSPRLQIEVLSNAPVLDVREKLPDLEVLYQAQDIAKSGKTLSVVIARIANRGGADLLSTFYDQKAPISLGLSDGTLVRADITEASNDYLRTAAGLTRDGDSVNLNPVILETNEWFTVKILALHDVEKQPKITVSGKIAGQHAIAIVTTDIEPKVGFWHSVVGGGLWVQLARVPIYVFGFTLLAAGLTIPAALITDEITARKRRNLLEKFKNKTRMDIQPADDFVFEAFARDGPKTVQRIINMVADPDRLKRRIESYLASQKDQDDTEAYSADILAEYPANYRRREIKEMMDRGFIEHENDQWRAVPDRLKVATAFVEYLDLVGAT